MKIRHSGWRFRAAARLSCLSVSLLFSLNSNQAQTLAAHSGPSLAVIKVEATKPKPASVPAASPATTSPAPTAPASVLPAPVPVASAAKPQAHLFGTVALPDAPNSTNNAPPSPLTNFTITEADAELEQRAFALINQARQAKGLPALVWDADAALLARAHSAQMATQGFFNHFDPAGRDVAARAKELKVRGWRALGENIAYNRGYERPADFAVERWLGSPSHLENIIRPGFTRAGLGVSRSAIGRIYFTQVFIER